MKLERMIGILSLLLQKEKVTAPELAAHFEVSKRTILRDLDALCAAGIPIRTAQGAGGGIQLMEGYRMDRTILSSRDMQMIIAGLRSLDSVSGSRYYQQLMEKLHAGSSDFLHGNSTILIDLSSWDKERTSAKIERIRTAIELKRAIRFDYFSSKGESSRLVEPYYLIFKWSSWYVWGFCRFHEDFRLFKLNRMEQLQLTEQSVAPRAVPMPEFDTSQFYSNKVHLKAQCEPSLKWQLIEHFGADSFYPLEDGSLLCELDMDEEGLISWLLSCRTLITVLEPQSIRERLKQISLEITSKYTESEEPLYAL